MDIQRSNRSVYPAVVPDQGSLRASASQRPFAMPSASEEVIDCVETHADNYQPASRRKATYPSHTDRPLATKGKWIDIWI
jgi:hypothetical protein